MTALETSMVHSCTCIVSIFLTRRAKRKLSIYWKTSIKKLRVCKTKPVTRYCYVMYIKIHSIKMLQNCLGYYCKLQLWQCKTLTLSLNRINHSNTNAKHYCYLIFSKKYACSHWLIHLTKMNDTIFCKKSLKLPIKISKSLKAEVDSQ